MKRFWLLAVVAGLILVAVIVFISMGFFSRFLGNKRDSKPVATSVAPSYQEDWASYLTTIDNEKVGSIMVDLGLKSVAPIASKSYRLRINVLMNYPSENGLPLQREFESLNQIDEKLSNTLTSQVGALYAGHLYCEGTMSLYYYIGENTSFETSLSEAMSVFSEYKYEHETVREENWQTYSEFLYPLPIQLQSILNHKVVAQLEADGDKLSKKRPVEHLIYFKNEIDIRRFIEAIKGQGFAVASKENVDSGEYRMALLLTREDAVDARSVDEYVLYLWQKAQDAGGDYDGWGSSIIKE